MRFLFTLIIYCSIMWQIASAQEHNYSQYRPFDSIGILKEKVVIPFDTATYTYTSGRFRGTLRPDSLSQEKIDYLTPLLQKDDRLVVSILLYDDFHPKENNREDSANFTLLHRAQNIIRKAIMQHDK